MNSIIQIKSLIASFFFGIFFFIATIYNYNLTKEMRIVKKSVFTFIFVLDIVLLYIYMIFKINNGNFHIYFLLMLLLGFIFISIFYKKSVNLCKKLINKLKLKK